MSETVLAQPDDLLTEASTEGEEATDMGSFNHSSIQANLAFLFKRLSTYRVSTELSLDVSGARLLHLNIKDELKPDVCLYPKRGLSRPFDILKMTEMPQLAVEILSPRQGTEEILHKFAAYFQLGVKSCWLVNPVTENVVVYAALEQHKTFSEGELFDAKMEIRLLIDEIFE